MGTATVERTQYSDRQKAEALALLTSGLSLREAERETGVPFTTLSRWRSGNAVNQDTLRTRDILNEDLATRFEDVANKLVNSVARMTNDEMSLAPVSQRMAGAGIAVDKMRLLRGEASPDGASAAAAISLRAVAELARMMQDRKTATLPIAVTGTTDVVIESTSHLAGDASHLTRVESDVDRDATVIPTSDARVTALTLGTCIVCGDAPADKISKSGAGVCSGCVPV